MSKPETRKFLLFSAFLACAACLGRVDSAVGQATAGTISETVQDIQGGAVAGAIVEVRNLDTNLKHSMVTEPDGRFRFPGLSVGPYELTAEHVGFARYLRGPLLKQRETW